MLHLDNEIAVTALRRATDDFEFVEESLTVIEEVRCTSAVHSSMA